MSIFKLKPVFKDYIWGGKNLISKFGKEYDGDILAESWELSTHKDGLSVIANGEHSGKTLAELINIQSNILGKNCNKFEDFPILIKLIDAKNNLSIQVHPDNEYAIKNEKQFGKTEMWYVASCETGAYLYYGFNKDISKWEFEERIKNNTLLEVLNKVFVKKGDVFFIEAGTIHAIGKDIIIAEIQQNSNVTYRVYDYGRLDANGNARDLHIGKAVEVTSTSKLVTTDSPVPHIACCEYFTVDKIFLDGKTTKSLSCYSDENSFVSLLVLDGSGKITSIDETIEYKKGDSIFITAGHGDFSIDGKIEALLTTIS